MKNYIVLCSLFSFLLSPNISEAGFLDNLKKAGEGLKKSSQSQTSRRNIYPTEPYNYSRQDTSESIIRQRLDNAKYNNNHSEGWVDGYTFYPWGSDISNVISIQEFTKDDPTGISIKVAIRKKHNTYTLYFYKSKFVALSFKSRWESDWFYSSPSEESRIKSYLDEQVRIAEEKANADAKEKTRIARIAGDKITEKHADAFGWKYFKLGMTLEELKVVGKANNNPISLSKDVRIVQLARDGLVNMFGFGEFPLPPQKIHSHLANLLGGEFQRAKDTKEVKLKGTNSNSNFGVSYLVGGKLYARNVHFEGNNVSTRMLEAARKKYPGGKDEKKCKPIPMSWEQKQAFRNVGVDVSKGLEMCVQTYLYTSPDKKKALLVKTFDNEINRDEDVADFWYVNASIVDDIADKIKKAEQMSQQELTKGDDDNI